MNTLLIEDDPMIGKSLAVALTNVGMTVNWIIDGEEGLAAAQSGQYALVLLDIGLPRKSGFEVLRTLRTNGNPVPLLIITARDGVDDLVSGLDLGADDYVVKPFSFGELMARIHAVMRRYDHNAMHLLSNGEITLNLATREASYRGSTALLTSREFNLLHALLEYPGRILSRSQIEERIYGISEQIESNAVEVLIYYLRKKFDSELIRNVRGVGWMVLKQAACLH
jgi:DNA-binding response OmpR family regulator